MGFKLSIDGSTLARGGLDRAELEMLVEQGASIAQIAEAVGRSKATVRHWLIRYGLKTHGAPRKADYRDQAHGQPCG